MRDVDQYRFSDPDVARCPFAYYAAMRREAPVHRDPGTGIWWVARNETVAAATFDVEALSSRSSVILKKVFRPRAQALWDAAGLQAIDTLVTGDPPEHDDYRSVAQGLFNPRKVDELTPHIQGLVDELIDAFPDSGELEFLEGFAARLPGRVVCDEFGLPREDQPRFKTWTDAVIGLLDPTNTEAREVELVERLIELFRYLEGHLQRVAQGPAGRVIHAIATQSKRDGTPFSALERGWMAVTTFVGGNETTMNMLTAGVRKLAVERELQARLRADLELVPRFTEEMLRLEGSVQGLLRVATRDVTLDGVTIPKGADVVLCSGSANRDEQRWPEADQFRLDRGDGRRHLTFGHGRHTCIGLHLARRELNVAFRTLLERSEDLSLAVPPESIEQVPLPFHRAIARLPLRFTARKA
ncbi:MAG TPA: cytochrome P450 [Nevskiaceae bacterium]|nr:cytochrome P450 [Nevskiaceae bacterium]